MNDTPGCTQASVRRSSAAVLVISAAVVALELTLMRCLSISRWHSFSYLVLSTALLGFGAAGTLLTFAGERLRRHYNASAAVIAAAFAVAVTLCYRLAEALPLNPRFLLHDRTGVQLAWMATYHALLFVPFFFGAVAIGLTLMAHARRVHAVYAANLIGSGLGGALAVGLMSVLPIGRLLHVVAGMGALSGLMWAGGLARRFRWALVAPVALALGVEVVLAPLEPRLDEYKTLATLRRWEEEGQAGLVLTRHGPRGRLDVYESPLLHVAMFAGLRNEAPPPSELAVLRDGDLAAIVFEIDSARDASILDSTPMSLPYRLTTPRHVLLLDEAGGTNVWLARRMGAGHVTIVQPNPQLVALMKGPLRERNGGVFDGPDVTVRVADPRVFLERTSDRFDVIQVVSTEALAAGDSGLRALHEDFLLTREGLALCMGRLTPTGILSLTRGVQQPPRDNVKMLATLRAALALEGVTEPAARMVQTRNYLAATTMGFAAPVGARQSAALRAAADDLGLDIEWAPSAELRAARQINEVEGPPGETVSYFRRAAERIMSGEGERFYGEWVYNVRPATDDSPYFYSFFRWESLPRFIAVYAENWLTRLELGYVVVVLALLQAILVGAALTLLPLMRLRAREGVGRGRLATCVYFTALGLAYMMLEMVCVLSFSRFLGDPIYSAACVISSFLVFSGLGSAASRRLCPRPRRAAVYAAVGVAVLAVTGTVLLGTVFRFAIGWPLGVRVLVAVALSGPPAFLMGWPFPNGMALVEQGTPPLVPWGWGTNGFASVAASPLAVMLAVGAGFKWVFVIVAGLYLTAAACVPRLGRGGAAASEPTAAGEVSPAGP